MLIDDDSNNNEGNIPRPPDTFRSAADMGVGIKDLLAPRFNDDQDDEQPEKKAEGGDINSDNVEKDQKLEELEDTHVPVDFERTPTMAGRELTPTDQDKPSLVEEPTSQANPSLLPIEPLLVQETATVAAIPIRSDSVDSNASTSSKNSTTSATTSTTSDDSDFFIPRAPPIRQTAGRPRPNPRPR